MGNAAERKVGNIAQPAQATQIEQQRPQRDEWVLSEDEDDCQQAILASEQDAEMAQLLEMGFTPKQARKVIFAVTLHNIPFTCWQP